MERHARIAGWGKYLPRRVVENEELEGVVGVNSDWIYTRTGIRRRHVADPEETIASLAAAAGREALQVAGLPAENLQLVIVSSTSAGSNLPAQACLVQAMLEAKQAAAFDLALGCAGFIAALATGNAFIRAGMFDRVLVVCAETYTRVVDWNDRNTAILFGDGAGAVLLEATTEPVGVTSWILGSDGTSYDLLYLPSVWKQSAELDLAYAADPSARLIMQGYDLYQAGVEAAAGAIQAVARQEGIGLQEIDLVVPHQANAKIIGEVANQLDLPEERFFRNLENTGNMAAASIPVALYDAIQRGVVRPGMTVCVAGYGSGLAWGASIIRWG